MGLDAFVACSCRREGKTCGHPDSHAASARIGSRPSVRAFQGVLRQLGGTPFPTLLAVLPAENGGEFSAAEAVRVVDELRLFRTRVGQARGLFLLDVESRDVICEYVPAYWGEFAWSARYEVVLGIDPQGFYVRANGGRQLFRATEFEQHPLPGLADDHPGQRRAEFVNIATRARFVSPMAVGGFDDEPLPRRLKLEMRMRRIEDFETAVAALEMLCNTSIETGNPVEWG